jgi:hypothetical protein
MNRTYSIVFVALFLLASHRAWGQGLSGNEMMNANIAKSMSLGYDTTYCDSLLLNIEIKYAGDRAWQLVYDSTMVYIEHCYNSPDAPSMFNYFSASLQQLAGADTSLWLVGRQWLESVLYLNTTNPEYFCACVQAIGGTFHSPSDTSETLYWKQQNRAFAIEEWMIQNTTCDTPTTLAEALAALRGQQYSDWLNDPSVPWDTTIPPLDSVQQGLKELLEKHLLYATVSGTPPFSILSNATANPNPTGEGTVISFGISKEAYVKIELFDVLGHEVEGRAGSTDLREGLFEPGNRSVPLSLMGLPSGTYFVRILTAYGEVQSVKLVKE